MNKSYEDKNSLLLYIKADHMFDDIRSDSRFEEIVRKIDL
jgi:hypothetical protein